MIPAEVVARARSALGRNTRYLLGAGGMNPAREEPANLLGECDCSGFVAWVLGVKRHTDNPWYVSQNGGWLETSAIFRDCATTFGFFDGVEWKDSQPGDLLVWGDRHDQEGKHHEGHVGIVSEVDPEGPRMVIHCSSGNMRATGDAIQETDVLIFKQHQARVARCAWVTQAVA